jgi:antitoxin (DNA-binding transcriptional repressor) of toxin-antitoxin stability system
MEFPLDTSTTRLNGAAINRHAKRPNLARIKMAMYDQVMDISVTQFRASCLELIRRVEAGGEPVDIKRRGKVVARLTPPAASGTALRKPWETLRGSGELAGEPEESVLDEQAFEAWR